MNMKKISAASRDRSQAPPKPRVDYAQYFLKATIAGSSLWCLSCPGGGGYGQMSRRPSAFVAGMEHIVQILAENPIANTTPKGKSVALVRLAQSVRVRESKPGQLPPSTFPDGAYGYVGADRHRHVHLSSTANDRERPSTTRASRNRACRGRDLDGSGWKIFSIIQNSCYSKIYENQTNSSGRTTPAAFEFINVRAQWYPFVLNGVLLIETLILLVFRILDRPIGRMLVLNFTLKNSDLQIHRYVCTHSLACRYS
jgi:hypothetical protein